VTLARGGVVAPRRPAEHRRAEVGDDVHRILRGETRLHWEEGKATADYLLDRWSAR